MKRSMLLILLLLMGLYMVLGGVFSETEFYPNYSEVENPDVDSGTFFDDVAYDILNYYSAE